MVVASHYNGEQHHPLSPVSSGGHRNTSRDWRHLARQLLRRQVMATLVVGVLANESAAEFVALGDPRRVYGARRPLGQIPKTASPSSSPPGSS